MYILDKSGSGCIVKSFYTNYFVILNIRKSTSPINGKKWSAGIFFFFLPKCDLCCNMITDMPAVPGHILRNDREGRQNHDTQAHLMGPGSERGQGVRVEKSQRVSGEKYLYCEKN